MSAILRFLRRLSSQILFVDLREKFLDEKINLSDGVQRRLGHEAQRPCLEWAAHLDPREVGEISQSLKGGKVRVVLIDILSVGVVVGVTTMEI